MSALSRGTFFDATPAGARENDEQVDQQQHVSQGKQKQQRQQDEHQQDEHQQVDSHDNGQQSDEQDMQQRDGKQKEQQQNYGQKERLKIDKQQDQQQKDDSQINFRIFLRPARAEGSQEPTSKLKQKLKDDVQTAFNVGKEVQINVWSISVHPFLDAMIGTLSFSKIPESIVQTRTNERTLPKIGNSHSRSLQLDLHFDGLIPLFSGSLEPGSLDIIAVPGLGGHAIASFMAVDQDNMWLRDELPRDLPYSRIFTYGYPSKTTESQSFQSLEDLGSKFEDVLQHLAKRNQEDGHPKPIVLIGHSLGGLVIKEAICKLFAEPNFDVLALIRGVLFFGTPNQGMHNSELLAMTESGPNEDLIRSLRYDSPDLRRQAGSWEKVLNSSQSKYLKIFSFYETSLSPTYINTGEKWEKKGPLRTLVDRNSATHGGASEDSNRHTIAIPRTHTNLVRFYKNDDVYTDHVMPILEGLAKTRQQRGLFYQNEEEKECINSLQFTHLDFRFDEIGAAHDSTCTWIFNNAEYKKWSLRRNGFLRLEGHRTSGKSTLMKHLVKSMESCTESVVMRHFFWQQGAEEKKDELLRNACGFFRSLMHQFLPYSYSALQVAMSKYKQMRSSPSWGPQGLKEQLTNEIPQACSNQEFVIMVDAIDECAPVEDRTEIMNFLQKLLDKTPSGNLRICVSYTRGVVTQKADIDVALNNYKDIAKFVQDKLSNLAETTLSVQPESMTSIPTEIQERAQGMFTWAEIACNKVIQMDDDGESALAIIQAIESLPKKLDDMFSNLIQDVQPQKIQETIMLFRWICFARRDLSVAELEHAMVMAPDMEQTSMRAVRRSPRFRESQEKMISSIFSLSRGLAKVVYPFQQSQLGRAVWAFQADDGVVRTIHDCVRIFLIHRGFGILDSRYSGNGREDIISSSHFHLSRSCINYLRMEEHHNWALEERSENSVSSFPLWDYATTSWLFHTEQVELANKSQDDLLPLLKWPNSDFYNTWLMSLGNSRERYHFVDTWVPPFPTITLTLLHVLAAHGIVSILAAILNGSDPKCNEDTVENQTYLSRATRIDQNGVPISSSKVEEVDCDVKDALDRTPLWYASYANKLAAVELLLSHGANPSTKDYIGETPFSHAARNASEKMTEIFVELPVERAPITETVMVAAIQNPRNPAKVVKLLVNKRCSEIKITPKVVRAAAMQTKGGLEIAKILARGRNLEKLDLDNILLGIIQAHDADTTKLFLQVWTPGIFSEKMFAAAASNRRKGAGIVSALLDYQPTFILTETIMECAAKNNGVGPQVMKALLGSPSIKTIPMSILSLAIKAWSNGKQEMRALLRDERTGKLPPQVMYIVACKARGKNGMIKALLMERRSEILQQLSETKFDLDLLIDLLIDLTCNVSNDVGVQVVRLFWKVRHLDHRTTTVVINRVTKNYRRTKLVSFLVRAKRYEILRGQRNCRVELGT